MAQKTGNDVMWFFYDSTGARVGIQQGNVTAYYMYNQQGDVIGLADAATGKVIAKYLYDAWGKCISVENANGYTIGTANPFRYRGYYYDTETGFYYLNSRYYNPEVGRFLNADAFASTDISGVLSTNMFAYCENNPVNRADFYGTFWKEIGGWLSNAWNSITTWVGNTFGAGSTTSTTISQVETPIIPDPSPITVKTGAKTTQIVSTSGDSSKAFSVYTNVNMDSPERSSAGVKINMSNFAVKLCVGLDDIGFYCLSSSGNTTSAFGVKINLSELKLGFEESTSIQWDNTVETTYTNTSINGWALVALYMLMNGQEAPYPGSVYG